jgi:cytidine deaminase
MIKNHRLLRRLTTAVLSGFFALVLPGLARPAVPKAGRVAGPFIALPAALVLTQTPHVLSASIAAPPAAFGVEPLAGTGASASSRQAPPQDRLTELLGQTKAFISAEKATELQKALGLTQKELLLALLPIAKQFAKPGISDYQVGAAALGQSGNIYLGGNLEFPGSTLGSFIHAEQSTFINARNHGEESILALAVTAAPCGHCRQFLNETGLRDTLQILYPDSGPDENLAALLPKPFALGPLTMLAPRDNQLDLGAPPPGQDPVLYQAAFAAANAAYARPQDFPSGVAIRTKDGAIYRGAYVKVQGSNPSVSPFQAALVALLADGKDYADVDQIILIEIAGAKVGQSSSTRELARLIAPQARVDTALIAPHKALLAAEKAGEIMRKAGETAAALTQN